NSARPGRGRCWPRRMPFCDLTYPMNTKPLIIDIFAASGPTVAVSAVQKRLHSSADTNSKIPSGKKLCRAMACEGGATRKKFSASASPGPVFPWKSGYEGSPDVPYTIPNERKRAPRRIKHVDVGLHVFRAHERTVTLPTHRSPLGTEHRFNSYRIT